MQETKNYKLKKPDYTDIADIAIINSNMDTVDNLLANKSDSTHSHNLKDINGSEITLINPSASSEGYFYLANWRYTSYNKFVLGYHENLTASDMILLEWTSEGKILNAANGFNIRGKTIEELMAGKAEKNHSHSLSDTAISGVLPLDKGGTGASTVSEARKKLGLGTAATYGVSTTPTSGSTALITSGAVYSALNNIDTNNRTHIVIATYNTKNPLKANADYTCTASNATSVIKKALSEIVAGGKIELLDGSYNLQYSDDGVIVDKSNITIEGSGWETRIYQPYDTNIGEAKPAFHITANNTHIKDMMLCSSEIDSPAAIISQASEGTFYENVFFICSGNSARDGIAECVKGSGNCKYTRIINCRIFRNINDASYTNVMFNYYGADSFSGIVGGNISSGYNNISLSVKNQDTYNGLSLYGNGNMDIYVNNIKI